MNLTRRAHFTEVPLHLDGQLRVKVTVEHRASGDGLVTVRPLRGRAYSLPLTVVAELGGLQGGEVGGG